MPKIKKPKTLKAAKLPRKTLKEKLHESYEAGKTCGWNDAVHRAIDAERELQKAQDHVHILEGDVDHIRKSLKPHSKLIEAATYFLNSSLMGYVKEFNVVASGMGNNTQDTACVSINIKMLDPQPTERVTKRKFDTLDYGEVINRKW